MSFLRDVDLLANLADRLKLGGAAELPDYWASTIVPQANQSAYQEILGRLLRRGFTKAQIDLWDRGREFQQSLGVYFALVNGGAYQGYDTLTIDRLDRRCELDTVLVFVAGVWVIPPAGNPGLVTTGGGVSDWPDRGCGCDHFHNEEYRF